MVGRRSLRKTTRRLGQTLDAYDRSWVVDWWSAAEDHFTTDAGNMSWLSTHIALTMALGASAEVNPRVLPIGYMSAMRAGYSLRACLGSFAAPCPLDVAHINRDAIEHLGQLPRDPESGTLLDVEDEDFARMTPTALLVSEVAEDSARFAELVSVDPGAWNGCVELAVYQLQKFAQERGLARRGKHFREEQIEAYLRYGFVLRALDEALSIHGQEDRAGASATSEEAL